MSGIVLFDTPIRRAATPWYRAGGAPVPLAAYQPKGAASLAASYVNLANPGTYDAAPGVAPTWSVATGWTFNGTTQYLTSGIVPASGWSAIVRFSAWTMGGSKYLFGSHVAGASFRIGSSSATDMDYYNGGILTIATGAMPAGSLCIAGQTAYRNGVAEAGAIPAWTAGPAQDIYVGARNLGDTPGGFVNVAIIAIAFYSSTLTAPQVAAVSTAMAAL